VPPRPRLGNRVRGKGRGDEDRRVPHVQAGKGEYRWRPKNKKDPYVPLNRALVPWVRRHLRDSFAGEHYLFHPEHADRPLSEQTAQRWTAEAFGRGGIKCGGRTQLSEPAAHVRELARGAGILTEPDRGVDGGHGKDRDRHLHPPVPERPEPGGGIAAEETEMIRNTDQQ
jgi:hypothetical protein